MKIILASNSQYKRNQLRQIGISVDSIAPQVSEDHSAHSDIEQLSIMLAQQKASDVQLRHPDAIIIGSDQTAAAPDGSLLTKPATYENAKNQLMNCSGKVVTFYSGMSILSVNHSSSWTVPTVVHFRSLNEDEIERYIHADKPLDCAGSFKVESLGISLFTKVESEDPSALIGLPLISLCAQLRKAGIRLP